MMVGRDVQLVVQKEEARPSDVVLEVKDLVVKSRLHHRNAVDHVSFKVRKGEIVCIAGIDGNGQTELLYMVLQVWMLVESGQVFMDGEDVTKKSNP